VKRKLFGSVVAVSVLVLVAAVLVSVSQGFANASLLRASHGVRYELTSADGAVDLARFSGWKPTSPLAFVLDVPDPGVRKRITASPSTGPLGVGWHPVHLFSAVGIRLASGSYVPPFSFRYRLYDTHFYLITVPDWLLIIVPATLPAAWMWQWFRRRVQSRRGFAIVMPRH
jgi:hypothetical protein